MPTNLPPRYYDVEEQYRKATNPEEKIRYLQEMMSIVPKHKGTDHLRADLRRKISDLKETSKKQKGPSRQESVYNIEREGAGQVVVIGPANVGKSSLVARLTNAEPEVEPYPYTTWTPTPGMMLFENIQIQLIDTPPLDEEYIEPQMMALIRRADLMLLMLDLQAFPIEQLETSLALLENYHIAPRRWRDRYDPSQGHFALVPLQILVNKCDDAAMEEDFQVLRELLDEPWPMLPVSVETGRNLGQMKATVFDRLEIVRIYAKPPGGEADLDAPFVMERGGTVERFAGKVHRDFLKQLKSARIWGHGVHDGQMVGRDHVLHDGDIVELRT